MKIFVDTAKLGEIKEALTLGIIDGVTTNPSLLREAIEEEREKNNDINLESYVREICRIVGKDRPVSLEVLSLRVSEMIKEAQILFEKFDIVARNVVIKIPINTYTGQGMPDYEGLKAIKKLSQEKIPTNATLVITPEQALLAAKAGATYVSPFAGRVDDYIRKNLGMNFSKFDYFDFNLFKLVARQKLQRYLKNSPDRELGLLCSAEDLKKIADLASDNGVISGVDLVRKIVGIFRIYEIKAKVIAASMRNPRQVREVAEAGADIATVPFQVIQMMLKHPKTEEGVKKFYADATQVKYEELFT